MLSYLKQDPGFYSQSAKLTIPIVLQNIITSTLTMADTFMVGILGEVQMAALTLALIPAFVLQLFLFGVQNGSSILISQFWGKGDVESIEKTISIGMWIAMLTTGTFATVMYFFPLEFMSLFGNEPEVVALAASYGKIIGYSYFLNGFTMMYVGAYRSMGSPKLGMYMLAISMSANLFLNWVFIYGNLGQEAMGIKGAALATLWARGIEVVLMLCHGVFGKNLPVKLGKMFGFDREICKKFFKYCAPVILNETGWGLGTSLFPTVMGHMNGSTEILAAYAIATNIERLVMVVGFGIGASSGIIIGNTVGAGTAKEKVLKMGQCLATMGFLCGFISGFVLLAITYTIFPVAISPLFKLSAQATSIAQIMLLFLSLSMSFRTFNTVVVVGVFRAGGDANKSMFVDLVPLWLVAIPLAVLTGNVWQLPIFWVVFAMKTEDIVKFITGVYFLRKPDWIHDVTQSAKPLEG